MALVIEDGTLVAGANSFATRAEIIAYAALRGVVIPDTDASDVNAIKAMDFIRALPCIKGELVDPEQPLPFPRWGLVEGDDADDWVFTIPQGVKDGQAQLAMDAFNGIDLTPSGSASLALKRSKVGPIEREFFAPGAGQDNAPVLTVAMAMLGPWICASGGMSLISVRR